MRMSKDGGALGKESQSAGKFGSRKNKMETYFLIENGTKTISIENTTGRNETSFD